MQNTFKTLLAACVFACGTLFAGNPLEPQKARVEKIGTEPVITLVKNGETGFEIVAGKHRRHSMPPVSPQNSSEGSSENRFPC